jgi:hypothetical protein
MILKKKETWEIGITTSAITYWKPTTCGQLDNFFKVKNGKDFKFLNTWSYYVPTFIQIFWLRWIFYIKITPKLISGEEPVRYVKFEDTHLEIMDVPKGNWDD